MLWPSDFEHENDSPCPLFLTLWGDKQTIDGQGKTDAPDRNRQMKQHIKIMAVVDDT
jgi:hypothetical protein